MGKGKPLPERSVLETAANALSTHADDRLWQHYQCKLVTPMYGGGVEAGKVDRKMPIRAKAIRGQLRFWWRLLNRSEYLSSDGKTDSKALFRAEREIWGGLGDSESLTASKVHVRIETPPINPSSLHPKDGSPLGKMIITEAGVVPEWLSEGMSFTLMLRDDSCSESATQALRMWASFGGVAARRRRGLGAIEVFDAGGQRINASKADIDKAGCKLYFTKEEGEQHYQNYRNAAEEALKRLSNFRQQPGLARGGIREGRPGGSYWPEANAVRKLSGRARQKNADALDERTAVAFPRALLGLPIVFQFKLHERQGDPFPATLEIADDGENKRDRFASPLVFGAWPETRGNRTVYRPMVLLLPTHNDLRQRALKLRVSATAKKDIPAGTWWPINPDQRKTLLPKRLIDLSGNNGDVLTAFINFFIKGASA